MTLSSSHPAGSGHHPSIHTSNALTGIILDLKGLFTGVLIPIRQ
eukprot:CAMPEP_0201099098 /NCGR_PEP_ID=MMETSP0812-20130820/8097_1 /ASSEMBLY_ACC=CAM_ASM_000668 /TAXON_ID=98059 /ORGANISM="Dinobryon sp., Strain UTEXLB2267" /LENGTH=43 /DNA_ID= /DNA_START= /DNA_END= /DNA_ORIENTATION=